MNSVTGQVYDLDAAIAAIRWVTQRCPLMPHQYATQRATESEAWAILTTLIEAHPASFLAFFEGYQRPNRYVDLDDGLRYWRTSAGRTQMVNRTSPELGKHRRVDEGAEAIPWDGPPWAPNGSGLYFRTGAGWFPKPDSGIVPCAACARGQGIKHATALNVSRMPGEAASGSRRDKLS